MTALMFLARHPLAVAAATVALMVGSAAVICLVALEQADADGDE